MKREGSSRNFLQDRNNTVTENNIIYIKNICFQISWRNWPSLNNEKNLAPNKSEENRQGPATVL